MRIRISRVIAVAAALAAGCLAVASPAPAFPYETPGFWLDSKKAVLPDFVDQSFAIMDKIAAGFGWSHVGVFSTNENLVVMEFAGGGKGDEPVAGRLGTVALAAFFPMGQDRWVVAWTAQIDSSQAVVTDRTTTRHAFIRKTADGLEWMDGPRMSRDAQTAIEKRHGITTNMLGKSLDAGAGNRHDAFIAFLTEMAEATPQTDFQPMRPTAEDLIDGSPLVNVYMSREIEPGWGSSGRLLEDSRARKVPIPNGAMGFYALKRALAGDPWAAYFVARMRLSGWGLHRDPEQAAKWAAVAVKGGVVPANALLAEIVLYTPNGDQRIDQVNAFLAKALEVDDPWAMVLKARLLRREAGFDQPPSDAELEWLRKAAALKHPRAKLELAQRLLAVQGDPAAAKEAYETVKREYRADSARALRAWMEAKGAGTEVDLKQAERQFSYATDDFTSRLRKQRVYTGESIPLALYAMFTLETAGDDPGKQAKATGLLRAAAEWGRYPAQQLLRQGGDATAAYTLPPLTRADWRYGDAPFSKDAIAFAEKTLRDAGKEPPEVLGIRSDHLSCFQEPATVYEIIAKRGDEVGVLGVLKTGDHWTLLDGAGGRMAKFTEAAGGPKFTINDYIEEYLRLYLRSLQGEGGTFVLVTGAQDLWWNAQPDPTTWRRMVQMPLAPTFVKGEDGTRTATVMIAFGGHLMRAIIEIDPQGKVKFVKDAPVLRLPLMRERYDVGLRVMRPA